MLLNIFGALLLIITTIVLFKTLKKRYQTHWRPFVGVGWGLNYDEKTKQVTIPTYFLKSPAGRANIKRGSILLARNGEVVPVFETKYDFILWVKSLNPEVGKAVTYKLLERVGKDVWEEREVTLRYERLRGEIPFYAPLPTHEDMHQDWKRHMPRFKVYYPTYRCPRTGITYHRIRIVPVRDFF
jgi:hypothetical protein